MDVQTPDKGNVGLGDLLVLEGFKGGLNLLPITAVEEQQLRAGSGNDTGSSPYALAIILKKDGSYLVGEELIRKSHW